MSSEHPADISSDPVNKLTIVAVMPLIIYSQGVIMIIKSIENQKIY